VEELSLGVGGVRIIRHGHVGFPDQSKNFSGVESSLYFIFNFLSFFLIQRLLTHREEKIVREREREIRAKQERARRRSRPY
jgi:hypothetical protein